MAIWAWKLQGKAHDNTMTGLASVIVNTDIFDTTLEQWPSLWPYYSGEAMQQELTPNEQSTYDTIRRASQHTQEPQGPSGSSTNANQQQDTHMADATQEDNNQYQQPQQQQQQQQQDGAATRGTATTRTAATLRGATK